MNAALVYVLLLKATATSFSGMGSLPQIRQDFVETYQLLTDEELGQAVLAGRSTPGPLGAYVVAVGYLASGWTGALAGWLAMITPALAVIPIVLLIQRWIHQPRIRAAVDAMVLASALLLVESGVRMGVEGYEQLVGVAAWLW